MFPIRDHNPSGRTPVVTYALISANILIFIGTWGITESPYAFHAFYERYALIPARPYPWSFLTSMFLHGGILHLLGNMLFLWIFGDNLEDEMGHGGFALFYVACGVAAGIVHVALSFGSPVPTVGASGAIAGVMGGYLLLFPRARVDILLIFIIFFRIFTVPAWLMLAIWFGLQLMGAAASDPTTGGIAYWAHAGGFVMGVVFTLPLWLRRGGPAFWQRTHGLPPHPAARVRRSDVPSVSRNKRHSRIPRVRRRRE
ncbi:rhomboid family intramembrane serine protease [Tropicimonas sp. IMCC6043]|uniref:rhomboid family intramembrane serine protease n=1 Tax=Tropicimonas sp. IMCC6043 TaxID=2510645 RepID=UPI00101D8CC1|nr:rhomboid family intramembrane serine protease [Tropicimonas sp. IMCC6043]RYH11730.1 rhomboid family intramembrane serine protease [Tropicimonas sp. IMCC6043]